MNFDNIRPAIREHVTPKRAAAYEAYFDAIRPTTPVEKFRRGLFALASVHTTWQLNCALYAQLWDLKWIRNPDLLKERLEDSRAGLANGRFKAFSQFAAVYWQFPGWIEKKQEETWYAYTDRIETSVYGLGPAKSAFLAELLYFQDTRVVCGDTHFLQLYGVAPGEVGSVGIRDYTRMITHYDCVCGLEGVAPCVARWCLWDNKQGQSTPRYWSRVLEPDWRPHLPKRHTQLELKVA